MAVAGCESWKVVHNYQIYLIKVHAHSMQRQENIWLSKMLHLSPGPPEAFATKLHDSAPPQSAMNVRKEAWCLHQSPNLHDVHFCNSNTTQSPDRLTAVAATAGHTAKASSQDTLVSSDHDETKTKGARPCLKGSKCVALVVLMDKVKCWRQGGRNNTWVRVPFMWMPLLAALHSNAMKSQDKNPQQEHNRQVLRMSADVYSSV